MKLFIALAAMLSFTCLITVAQRPMTEDEIIAGRDKHTRDSLIINKDSSLNVRVVSIIDSLRANKVDSIIVYSTAYIGYFFRARCGKELYPITTYVIWNIGGETTIRQLRGSCFVNEEKSGGHHFFDFYKANYQKLKGEIFMPVIYSGTIYTDGKECYEMSHVSHEPNYSFYYSVGNVAAVVHFAESHIENKESIFHKHNLDLAAYEWWQIVQKELKE